MNDRQRLEAIIAVVCKYLPPNGISIEKAMNEIISLVDPLPPQHTEQEPVADDFFKMIADRNPKPFPPLQRTWVGLFDEEIWQIATGCTIGGDLHADKFARAIESKLKEVNT
jgi:hypothetical protein